MFAEAAVKSRGNPFQIAYKRIRLKPQAFERTELIEEKFGLSSVAARILAARGFSADEKLKQYLDPTLKEGLPPPSDLRNLDKACDILAKAIKEGSSIAICCDFDVDGLSGGSQIYYFLKSLGVNAKVFVPDRFEDGYGLNAHIVRSIAEQGFKVLLTVDFGTTNAKEIEVAKALGLTTIVMDHHHVGDHDPGSHVFVNPQQEGCGFADKLLSAAGLAWYLVVGLRGKLKNIVPKSQEIDPRSFLDLACLGTICDMVPLLGANRVIAKRGLELLSTTERIGLCALKEVIPLKGDVGCRDVSFGIGPRLNAAGRMVHGEMVIDLLTSLDKEAALKVARELNRLNLDRQDTEVRVKNRAVDILEQRYHGQTLPSGLVVWEPTFHTGVIGIVAQRLVESFYRPSVVLGLDTEGIFKGSVRGIKGFNVVEALEGVSTHLIKFGGHEGAGGLAVEEKNLERFAEAFDAECRRRLKDIETSPFADADTEVKLPEVNIELVHELKGFAPFGMGNPQPQLLVRNLQVVSTREIKSAHLKVTFSDGQRMMNGMLWRQVHHPALVRGQKVDVVFKPDINTYQGITELQANIEAIEASR